MGVRRDDGRRRPGARGRPRYVRRHSRRPDETTTAAIETAQDAIASIHGVEWDTWYVLADAARGADPPHHAWRDERRDTSWAVNRAHWLAGRYANFHGPEPTDLVKAPTWEELEGDLDRELEHMERHVMEGDTDPYEATYAMLNGSRILHSVETHNVAISKRAAGAGLSSTFPPAGTLRSWPHSATTMADQPKEMSRCGRGDGSVRRICQGARADYRRPTGGSVATLVGLLDDDLPICRGASGDRRPVPAGARGAALRDVQPHG